LNHVSEAKRASVLDTKNTKKEEERRRKKPKKIRGVALRGFGIMGNKKLIGKSVVKKPKLCHPTKNSFEHLR